MFFFLAKVLKNTILFREYSPHRRGGLKRRKVVRFFLPFNLSGKC